MMGYKILLFVYMSILISGCAPDLVVATLEASGPASVNTQGDVEVPVRVIIKNQGNAAADIFKTAIEYTGPKGICIVPFNVQGQKNPWYPYTNASLPSGGEAVFSGKVILNPSKASGIVIALKAIADSCSGDDSMPDYCRVKESSERNNGSKPIPIIMP